jgi:hypothetical protein
MQPPAVFGISVFLSLVVWGIIGARDIWPVLRRRPRAEALRPLLLLHAFRFVGLAFLVPGVVSPDLPDGFARPAAYGDLTTSILALLAIVALRTRLGTILVWVFNIVGTVDLLNAFYQGNQRSVGITPGLQGAAYFIPTVLVPLLLVTHVLVFAILLRTDRTGDPRGGQTASAHPRPGPIECRMAAAGAGRFRTRSRRLRDHVGSLDRCASDGREMTP